ncbi:hypothetical protein ACXZ66_06850 [Corynebacterium sp. S7]
MEAKVTQLPRELDSALTKQQWALLEDRVFSGAGEATARFQKWANHNAVSPVAALIMGAVKALACLPPGTKFNAGLRDGSTNTFVVLVGKPGQGKDELATAIAEDLNVTHHDKPVQLLELPVGSGEGMALKLQPDEEGNPASPVLFSVSEVGDLEAKMKREGSTLRSTLLSAYSGGGIGSTNKGESSVVPRNSYTMCMWVGCQPDKAGALLEGSDDGFAHRFIWTELVNPNHQVVDLPMSLAPVVIPDDIKQGFTFPVEIQKATVKNKTETLMLGAQGGYQGHTNLTRLKLSCGLALIRSSRHVSMGDWVRAGHLMDYSNTVRQRSEAYLQGKRVERDAERLQRREEADERNAVNRRKRYGKKILAALADDSTEEALKWGAFRHRKFANKYREDGSTALEELAAVGAVTKNFDADGNFVSVSQGPKFTEYWNGN